MRKKNRVRRKTSNVNVGNKELHASLSWDMEKCKGKSWRDVELKRGLILLHCSM